MNSAEEAGELDEKMMQRLGTSNWCNPTVQMFCIEHVCTKLVVPQDVCIEHWIICCIGNGIQSLFKSGLEQDNPLDQSRLILFFIAHRKDVGFSAFVWGMLQNCEQSHVVLWELQERMGLRAPGGKKCM